mmetsp:Transcript_21783/g.33661  ORF Transcript_21783/g.33661 Transcript_21783/m.33661 type:complete len:123 (+) Transcript_21783:2740-3108(+)
MNSLGGKPSKDFTELPPFEKPTQGSNTILVEANLRFKEIKMTTSNLILDPLLEFVLTPCKRCCIQRPVYRRQKVLEQCEEKFNEELEITNLLSKIRDTHDMTRHLKNEAMTDVLKYSKARII